MKKLRNKETGEIGNLVLNINPDRESYSVLSTENGNTICGNLVIADYDTLAELSSKWEDYEEPKEWWSIDQFGDPINVSGLNSLQLEKLRIIGNLFRTEEEAEKAAEKLKAWERLKDKGFRFKKYSPVHMSINYGLSEYYDEAVKDLDLLFGGDE